MGTHDVPIEYVRPDTRIDHLLQKWATALHPITRPCKVRINIVAGFGPSSLGADFGRHCIAVNVIGEVGWVGYQKK